MAVWELFPIRPFFNTTMNIIIRCAARSDISAILQMMKNFADHVSLGEYLTLSETDLADAVFGKDAFVRLLVASADGELAGYAIFYPHFSSFRGERGFFLEDIFIKQSHRGFGAGLRLLKEIAREADRIGFNRIDFQVLKDNYGALSFYKKLGAETNEGEMHFKFAGEAFAGLVRDHPDLG